MRHFFPHVYSRCRSRTGLCPDGKPSLRHQFHGACDGNPYHACLLVQPTIAVQCSFFLHAEVVDLPWLVGFQTRLGEFCDLARRYVPRVGGGLHQRILHWLVPPLVPVQIAVHPFQGKNNQHANDSQADQKEEDRFIREIFALKLGFLVSPVDVFVFTHPLCSCAGSRTSTAKTSYAGTSGSVLRLRKKYASHRPPIAIGTTMSSHVILKVIEKLGSIIQNRSTYRISNSHTASQTSCVISRLNGRDIKNTNGT